MKAEWVAGDGSPSARQPVRRGVALGFGFPFFNVYESPLVLVRQRHHTPVLKFVRCTAMMSIYQFPSQRDSSSFVNVNVAHVPGLCWFNDTEALVNEGSECGQQGRAARSIAWHDQHPREI